MAYPLYVAFVWHQHQPLYYSASGQYHLPWVRLHGTKDYLDLMLLLQRYPQLHQTVNLVPTLIRQLEDYSKGNALDPYLNLTLTPENRLDRAKRQYIIDHFFDGNYRTLIDPHPRYRQLYEQRKNHGAVWCLHHWTQQDYSDLLAWHNLAWIDPLFWSDPEIAAWLEKGKNFTLRDRQKIYAKQLEIIRQIIPQHKRMQENGQLELITSPYTHPILPLLADTNITLIALPEITLPQHRFQWEEDIPRHLENAKAVYQSHFETQPQGIWPSELAISPQILPHLADAGFKWFCSDEAILGWTLKHFFHRNEQGTLYAPELLYRPYRLPTEHGDLAVVFRDHRLSDLIGFTYSKLSPKAAANDFIQHLDAIGASLGEPIEQPWLVTIALDGENCWEQYQQDGKPFLEALYQRLSDHPGLELVTVSEFIEQYPPTATLPSEQLHSGSWVDGNLNTWIGDPIKNRAWDLLTAARETLAQHPEATPENNPDAYEALYAAEGSDWFWWFGEGHSSNQDAIFDQLFRDHLAKIYQSLSLPIPHELKQPLESHQRKKSHPPLSFIHPFIDGIADEQDWDKAGRIDIATSGAMHQNSDITRLWYGLDHLNFYFRFDFKKGGQPGTNLPPELHLFWFYPGVTLLNSRLPLQNVPQHPPLDYFYHHHLGINIVEEIVWLEEATDNNRWFGRRTRAKFHFNECLELSVPWEDLGMSPDIFMNIIVVFSDHAQFRSYYPEKEFIVLQIP
ncbi:alpha-amylase/alpha-mannosidase [Dactylococcopsis salina]|uniref:Alpha-amylase/alpha-mannosidase n=1 Tax=Dactylococcopsis salina (strain PCC 8305) TaxID=13035 RepID=K9YXG1_DACS8|nr:alpha-amylase/alpha-mannosidase [Dactylococcopsis salina]AFZ51621.1 alpha-amylase/alpha-mannosidase [Dactylococcopsis salina PCC 8305]